MRCTDPKGAGTMTQLHLWEPFLLGIFAPRLLALDRKGEPLNADIRTITDALEAKGVFSLAYLLDPEAIVNVAMALATTPNPNDYTLWLGLYAARYEVATHDLAVDVLIVLSHAADYVGAGIAKAAHSEVRQLAVVLWSLPRRLRLHKWGRGGRGSIVPALLPKPATRWAYACGLKSRV